MASVWYWRVSLQMECFSTFRFTKMQVPFLSFRLYRLILCHFFLFFKKIFDRLLIFLRCKEDFGYLGLCFPIRRGLECFFRTGCQLFPRVTIPFTTRVTTLSWKFCTVFNALLLLAHSLLEKQHFHKNAQRKYHIFLIFRNWRKYRIFRKTKSEENIIFSIISCIFCNKSIEQDNDKKKWLED